MYARDGGASTSVLRACTLPSCEAMMRRIFAIVMGLRSSHQSMNSTQRSSPLPSTSKISISCESSSWLTLTPKCTNARSNSYQFTVPLSSSSNF